METIQTKCCTKCGVEKPKTDEYFKPRKLVNGISFRGECRDCHNKISSKRYNKRVKVEMMIPSEKKCSKCDITKSSELFHKNSGRIDGLSTYCKDCCNEYKRNDLWRERDKVRNKIRYNTSEHKEYVKKYRNENRIELNIRSCKYARFRRETDPLYRIKNNVKRRIHHVIKGKKQKPTLEILGANRETLMKHIESYFQPGMTWDNYGIKGWHIDHHYPLAMAKTNEDVYRLNHYTNLRPLWWEDNLKKSDKLPEEFMND